MRIAVAIISLLILSIVIVYPLPSPPRHVDPRNVKEEESLLASIESLVLASRLVGEGDIWGAKYILGNLSEAPLPPSVRTLYTRIIEIVNITSDYINTSRSLIDEAVALIEKGDYEGAEERLNESIANLSRVNVILSGLQDLIAGINIPGLSQRASQTLGNINNTVNNLMSRSRDLLNVIAHRSSLIGTNITVEATPRSAWYGDTVLIRGALTDHRGEPLSNRSVVIHVGPVNMTVVTDRLGRFETIQRLIYYNNSIDIYAEYIPRGADSYIYAYSRSEIINITLIYIAPVILATLNTTAAKPGDTVLLNIRLSREAGVNIATPFKNITLPQGSEFHVNLKIPGDIDEGIYPVNISVIPQGIIGPANWSTYIKIYRLDNNARIDYPGHIFTGITYAIKIYSEAPSEISAVSRDPGIELLVTGNEIFIHAPHTFLGSSADLVVTIVPKDPGYKVSIMAIRINVYNALVIGATAAFTLIIIGAAVMRRNAREAGHRPEEEALSESMASARMPLEIDQETFSIIKTAQRLIETLTGMPFRKSYTYREYYSIIAARLPTSLGSVINKFFSLLERYLYGGPGYRGLLREIASIAGEIVRLIKGAVKRD